MSKYNPSKIEKKWQKYWENKKLHEAADFDREKKNFMLLVEFPYPSGDLHTGHWFAFSVPDIYGRYLRMNGYNVTYPMGFDAFGLPAENAAIQRKIHPGDWTKKNIKAMTKQLQSMGAAFDWSREVQTIDPEYYKWTQWIFIQLYKAGLAYRAQTFVNWCPKDKTVLANEQVLDGKCDRCGTSVEQRELSQWMFKITSFADRLIDDIQDLDWPQSTKLAQQNWIGRSEGAVITFNLNHETWNSVGSDSRFKIQDPSIKVFTTRADTLFGGTFIVISPELAQKWIDLGWSASQEVKDYISQSFKKTELQRQEEVGEKTGVPAGFDAINPMTDEKMPVWVADFVLGHYGTGAVFADAHDERDVEFAKKYNIPLKITLEPVTGTPRENEEFRKSIVAIVENPKTGKILSINWGSKLGGNLFVGGGVDGEENLEDAARREVKEETGYKNLKLVSQSETIHHHYIAHSKGVNRYIHAVGFYFQLINEEQDSVALEKDEAGKFKTEWLSRQEAIDKVKEELHSLVFQRLVLGKPYTGLGILTDSGKYNGMHSDEAKKKIVEELKERGVADFQKNYRLHDWVLSRQRYWGVPIPMVKCDECGYQPVSDSELPIKLPPLKDFMPADDGRSPLAKAGKWLKVKCPNCGKMAERETDTMDTFVDSSWYFLRYTDPQNKEEFASRDKMVKWLPVPLYFGGAEHNTMHLLYARFITKALRSLNLLDFSEPFLGRRNHGFIMDSTTGQKMSKSKGQAIDPDKEVAKHGADAVRLYFAFLGPYDQNYNWNSDGLLGVRRFLDRAWNFVQRYEDKKKDIVDSVEITTLLNRAAKEVGEQIKQHKFNTGVSHLMKLLNSLEEIAVGTKLLKNQYEVFLKLLAPFAPHITEELWSRLHSHESATKQSRILDSLRESGQVPKNYRSIHVESWPEYDESLLQEESVTLVVQINGKLRDSIEVKRGMSEEDVKKLVLASEKIQKHLDGKEIRKFVYVQDKLANLVI